MTGNVAPLVSMVVPLYNHAKYVRACINSIIQQDYPQMELLIIDDGSTDDSAGVVRSLIPACEARFVRFEFRTRPNKGLSSTINEGLEWCQGEYFAALASDDVLLPNKTSRLVSEIENEPNVAGVFSGFQRIDDGGRIIDQVRSEDRRLEFKDLLYGQATFAAASQLLRLKLVKAVGGYPPNLYIEDWYMWLTLTKHGHVLKTVSDPLVQYRQHDTNISKNADKMYEGRLAVLRYFQGEPGANRAMANICLRASIDATWVSKRRSSRYLAASVRAYPGIALTQRFAYAVSRLGVPKAVHEVASKLRKR